MFDTKMSTTLAETAQVPRQLPEIPFPSFIFLLFFSSSVHLSLKMSPEILELARFVKMYHVEVGVKVVSLKKTERCPEVECGAELC